MALEFEWDNGKAKKNLRKHAVSFDEATSAFYDALSVTIPDPDHSAGENRFLLIGKTVGGYLVVVSVDNSWIEPHVVGKRLGFTPDGELVEAQNLPR